MIELLRSEWSAEHYLFSDCLAWPQSKFESRNYLAIPSVAVAARLVEQLNHDGWKWDRRCGMYSVEVTRDRVVDDLTGEETEMSYRLTGKLFFRQGEVSLLVQVRSHEYGSVEEAVEKAVAYVQKAIVEGEKYRPHAEQTAMRTLKDYGRYLVTSGEVVVRYRTTTKTGQPRWGRHVFGVYDLSSEFRVPGFELGRGRGDG